MPQVGRSWVRKRDEVNEFVSIYLVLLVALGFNRNENQKQKNKLSGE
jgi:hypothetical protein